MRCGQWRDRGILADLFRYHGLESPDFDLLDCISHAVAAVVQVAPLRLRDSRFNDETRKTLLIGWFNHHYRVIAPHIRNLVLRADSGEVLGPHADEFTNWAVENPDASIVRYLDEHK
jgi:hypothetical protein